MPMISNKRGVSAVIHATANETFVVVGNSTVSNIAASDETAAGVTISQVWWGAAASGYWKVSRGSNTVLVLDSSSYKDFAGCGVALSKDPTANIVCELVGTGNGYIMMELQKVGRTLSANNTGYDGIL